MRRRPPSRPRPGPHKAHVSAWFSSSRGDDRACCRSSLRWLRTNAAKVVDDVPHVRGGHLGVAADTVGDDSEDLAVAGSVLPLGIGEIGRTRVLRRERAVAEAFWPV